MNTYRVKEVLNLFFISAEKPGIWESLALEHCCWKLEIYVPMIRIFLRFMRSSSLSCFGGDTSNIIEKISNMCYASLFFSLLC